MEIIRCYFSKRGLFGPLQSSHHVKTHTHSMGLVSFRRNFSAGSSSGWIPKIFWGLGLGQLWMTRLAIFSSLFFHRGALGSRHFSVKCLSHADSPTQLVLVLSTGSFKIEIVRGRLQQKGNRVTYYLRRRHPHSHRKITWNNYCILTLLLCVHVVLVGTHYVPKDFSHSFPHPLLLSPSPCVSSPAFPL